MKIKEYNEMMRYLTRPKDTDAKKILKEISKIQRVEKHLKKLKKKKKKWLNKLSRIVLSKLI